MRDTDPVNLWGALTARIASQTVVIGLLSGALLLTSSTIAYQQWRGTPVYFLPPGGPGLSLPGVIPDAAATDYASRWLMRRYTFTPATVKAAHAEVATGLHPALSLAFDAQAKREAVLVKEAQLATQVQVRDATVSHRSAGQVVVHLDAVRTVWIGGQQVREEPIQADLTLVPWYSGSHPAGLVVLKASLSPALSVSGT
jgi:hypothetical protein